MWGSDQRIERAVKRLDTLLSVIAWIVFVLVLYVGVKLMIWGTALIVEGIGRMQ